MPTIPGNWNFSWCKFFSGTLDNSMSQFNVCALPTSTSIEDIIMDWDDHAQLLLNQIETDIFENNEPNMFAPEYVNMCAARMKAKYNLNSLPPDERWIRKFCREHLVRVGYKLYRCRSTIFGS